jgi:hypothetical protein
MSNNPRFRAWCLHAWNELQKPRYTDYYEKINDEKILDNIDIEVIERYLRKKKLEKISKIDE